MKAERECTIFCPKCNVDKADVMRVKATNADVYHHITNPPDFDRKLCDCGAVLERK